MSVQPSRFFITQFFNHVPGGLAVGSDVVALVKSTEVSIAKL